MTLRFAQLIFFVFANLHVDSVGLEFFSQIQIDKKILQKN